MSKPQVGIVDTVADLKKNSREKNKIFKILFLGVYFMASIFLSPPPPPPSSLLVLLLKVLRRLIINYWVFKESYSPSSIGFAFEAFKLFEEINYGVFKKKMITIMMMMRLVMVIILIMMIIPMMIILMMIILIIIFWYIF